MKLVLYLKLLYVKFYLGVDYMAKSNSFFNIDMLVLSILKGEDCYGYEIVKRMREVSDGVILIKEGTLYPILYTLMKKEFISSRDEIVNRKIRVYYHIEPTGIEYLLSVKEDFKKSIEGVFKILDFQQVGE